MGTEQKILDYINENNSRLIDILSEIIALNTENDGKSGNETPLAEYLKNQYEQLGYNAQTYCPADYKCVCDNEQYLKGRNINGRKNITAVVQGKNSRKSLMLAGHLDTVPAGDVSMWKYPPFSATVKDGMIFGRGVNDDKYALACCLFIAEMFKNLNIELANDIYMSGYVDEEFGGGNGALACCVNYPCDFYINLDGDTFDIWNTATGGQRIAIHLKHKDAVSSCEEVVEGLYICKKHIDRFAEKRRDELEANKLYSESETVKDALRYMAIASGTNTSDKDRGYIDFAFYTDKDKKTIDFQLQTMFDDISDDLGKLSVEIERVEYKSRFFEYSLCMSDREEKRLKDVALKTTGRGIISTVSPLSDLNIFMSVANGNALGFGIGQPFDVPGGAHQTDEALNIESLIEFTKILSQYIVDWDRDDI